MKTVKPRAIIGVLLGFPDEATSVPMIKHAMCIRRDAIRYLNPGQTPVLRMDQPINEMGELIQ